MSIYLDEKNPGKHKPFDDAAPGSDRGQKRKHGVQLLL